MTDIFFTYDFFPKVGGAHFWLYKVAYNWPKPSMVLTAVDNEHFQEASFFDKQEHGSIRQIIRLPFRLRSGGIDRDLLPNSFLLFKFLRQFLISSNITVHAVRVFPEAATVLLAKLLWRRKLRLIIYVHGEEFLVAKTSKQLKFLTYLGLKYADLVIANSYSTKKLVKKFGGCTKLKVVHLGVDFNKFQRPLSERQNTRAKWNFFDDVVILVTIARMEPHKNHESVIRVLKELYDEGLTLAYVLGSTGEKEKDLKRLVHDLKLNEIVRFLGYLSEEEKIKTLCAADIHIMPSIQVGPMIEGFGIVFMEAAAAGLPSIAGKVGGQPEAVLHGKTGLIVDGTNLNEIKEAIKRLVTNAELRKEMGNKAREWARAHDWSIIAQKIWELQTEIE